MNFHELRIKARANKTCQNGIILALDPGETTGYVIFDGSNSKILEEGQIKTWPIESAIPALDYLFNTYKPSILVFESYQVYEWKKDEHSWSQIPTVQLIGCIKTLSIQNKISYITQTAQIAKSFCTDEKLQQWGFYIKGKKHARDAIRHGCYYLLFGEQ